MSKKASERAYRKAGVGPGDVQVVELHDCFSANELISYEALGLCGEGRLLIRVRGRVSEGVSEGVSMCVCVSGPVCG